MHGRDVWRELLWGMGWDWFGLGGPQRGRVPIKSPRGGSEVLEGMGCGIQVDTVHSFREDNGAEASAATLKAHSPSLHPHLLPSALRVYADPAPKEQWEPSETASPSVCTPTSPRLNLLQ